MKHYLFMTALFLGVFWAVGYFIYDFGGSFHMLIVVSALLLVYRFLRMKKIIGHHKHHKHNKHTHA
ncbi:lmo0937 family membrane protein [Flavobacterium sp.]|uniref:lmo0937 family membrane protein n=1 Tax=Flavobacterium sp. TaxID=239 RepID=UPI00261A851B|nr:lmo0937 family membrane protein [Flavobacterium sp.]